MSWLGDRLHDIGHAASDVWHGVTGGVSDAAHAVSGFVNKTPLKGVFAPINFVSDVLHGDNVLDSLGQRSLQLGASTVWLPAKVDTLVASTSVGKAITKGVDSFTGGFASRTLEAENYINKVNFSDDPLNKHDSTKLVKDVGINAAEAAAVVATAGAAGAIGSGAGLSGTALSATSAFAAVKAGSAVGQGLSSGNIAGALNSVGSVLDDATGLPVSSLTGALDQGSGSSAPMPAPAPRAPASSGVPFEPFTGQGQLPDTTSSLVVFAALGVGAWVVSRAIS